MPNSSTPACGWGATRRPADASGRDRRLSLAQTVVLDDLAGPQADAAPDRVDRKFLASAPHQLSVADVTYMPTVQGWLHLACVTDVVSRMIAGRSMAGHRKTDLVVKAVTMAVHRRGGHVPGVIHHRDRGGECSSHILERELRTRGAGQHGQHRGLLRQRLGRKRVATLECELFDQQPGGRFTTRQEAKLAVFDYLETLYKPRRRHSTLGQIWPPAFEAAHPVTTAA